MENKHIGDFEVSESGIERVIDIGDYGSYTTELIIPKDIFVEAINKYMKDKDYE